jgi:hypothetical protein
MVRFELVKDLKWWRVLLIMVCVGTSAVGLFNWAPWSAAITPEECLEKHHHAVPAEWRAVIINHGQFIECRRGLPKDHAVLFATFAVMYFGGGAAVILLVGRIRWERREPTTLNRSEG